MMLDRQWIESHVPHSGSMCLLDGVLEMDATSILCRTGTHRLRDNPLRSADTLASLSAIEYAAQAIAAHGASQTNSAPNVGGMLASVRAVELLVERLDDIPGDLWVRATRVGSDETALLYEFVVLSAPERVLARGRLTVALRSA